MMLDAFMFVETSFLIIINILIQGLTITKTVFSSETFRLTEKKDEKRNMDK